MLGIRLAPADEAKLEKHARSLGRPKSALARDWIKERLERESIDLDVRRAAEIISAHESAILDRRRSAEATDSFLQMLDELDGGFDWGPEGSPA